MKAVRLRVALTAALAAFLPATAGHQVQAGAKMSTRGPGALKRNSNIARPVMVRRKGFRGFYAMPRLAGQQPQYIENQLHAFLERRRLNPVMANVAHGITPDMIPALAARMSTLNPPPVGGVPAGDAALGKEIFANGLPDQNVPACSACHGPGAGGQREYLRLAGQLYWYMVAPCRSGAANAARAGVRTYHGSCGQPWRI